MKSLVDYIDLYLVFKKYVFYCCMLQRKTIFIKKI